MKHEAGGERMLYLTQNGIGASVSARPKVKVRHLVRGGPRMHCAMWRTQTQLEPDALNEDLPYNRKELLFFCIPYVAFRFPN